MEVNKVLFINQEITPYVADTEMSVAGKELPNVIQQKGHEIRTFMPKWGVINERRGQLHEVIRLSGMNLIIDDTDHQLIIKVASIAQTRVQVYFIDNDEFFCNHDMTIGEDGKPHAQNVERAVFFARGVLETVKKLRWIPEVIHCQGWMSSIVPAYIKVAYKDEPSFANVKVVTTVCANEVEGNVGEGFGRKCNFKDATAELMSAYGDNPTYNNLLQLAIDYSDGVAIAPSADKTVADYARNKGIKVLELEEGNFDAYNDFFENL